MKNSETKTLLSQFISLEEPPENIDKIDSDKKVVVKEINELYKNFKEMLEKDKDLTLKDFLKKNRNPILYRMYFFASKGLKCFDKNGNKLQKEFYIRIQHNL